MLDESSGQQRVKEEQYALPPTFQVPVRLGRKAGTGRRNCVMRIWERCMKI